MRTHILLLGLAMLFERSARAAVEHASPVTSPSCRWKRYGEENPLRQTIAAIDSHRPVRAHGESRMPVWGEIFERDMRERHLGWPQATTVQQEHLIAEYVMTLQQ